MHPNARRIEDFYAAFARGDAEAMASAYADDARFHDPVFPDLSAPQARAMWRMLIQHGTDLQLRHGRVEADDTHGSARWEASYTFRKTGRTVDNVIDARFRFKGGLIVEHRDSFDLWRWTRMALGPTGVLLGWTPLLRGKIQRMAGRELARFMAKTP